MMDGFKMFQTLGEGASSALNRAAKTQQEQDRKDRKSMRHRYREMAKGAPRRTISDDEERNILARQVEEEIQVRLKKDPRFQKAFGLDKGKAPVNKQGVKVVNGIPKEWLSEEKL